MAGKALNPGPLWPVDKAKATTMKHTTQLSPQVVLRKSRMACTSTLPAHLRSNSSLGVSNFPRNVHRVSLRKRMRKSVCMSIPDNSNSTPHPLRLTYLEGNSWLWEVKGKRILVDPVLVGNLDFGAPWLYDGAKKYLKNFQLEDLKPVDYLLITQSLDDHCHEKTLNPLSKIFPDLIVISTPNAESILSSLFNKVVYIEPGQSTQLTGEDGVNIEVCASAGPILGPPWQRPENGYFIKSNDPAFVLYYEPHCVYNKESLQAEKADVVVTPVIKQLLPGFTLVSGQEEAVELARLLNARFVVPMNNGDLENKGFLSKLINRDGTVDSFKQMLSNSVPHAQVLEPLPGIVLDVPVLTKMATYER